MEHVPDDLKALRNIYKCLQPGGEAWILVPLHGQFTVEGNAMLSPKEREAAFGQWDHVRQYGDDIIERIVAAGFAVEIAEVKSVASKEILRLGLSLDDKIFIARRTDHFKGANQ